MSGHTNIEMGSCSDSHIPHHTSADQEHTIAKKDSKNELLYAPDRMAFTPWSKRETSQRRPSSWYSRMVAVISSGWNSTGGGIS